MVPCFNNPLLFGLKCNYRSFVTILVFLKSPLPIGLQLSAGKTLIVMHVTAIPYSLRARQQWLQLKILVQLYNKTVNACKANTVKVCMRYSYTISLLHAYKYKDIDKINIICMHRYIAMQLYLLNNKPQDILDILISYMSAGGV